MRAIFTITLFLLSCLATVRAQNNESVCRTGFFEFQCPIGSNVLNSGKVAGPFVAVLESKMKMGVFGQEIANGSTDEKAVNELIDTVFQQIYSRTLADFQLKESKEFRNAPYWRYSEFEEKKISEGRL